MAEIGLSAVTTAARAGSDTKRRTVGKSIGLDR